MAAAFKIFFNVIALGWLCCPGSMYNSASDRPKLRSPSLQVWSRAARIGQRAFCALGAESDSLGGNGQAGAGSTWVSPLASARPSKSMISCAAGKAGWSFPSRKICRASDTIWPNSLFSCWRLATSSCASWLSSSSSPLIKCSSSFMAASPSGVLFCGNP